MTAQGSGGFGGGFGGSGFGGDGGAGFGSSSGVGLGRGVDGGSGIPGTVALPPPAVVPVPAAAPPPAWNGEAVTYPAETPRAEDRPASLGSAERAERDFTDRLRYLEDWAHENHKDARRDTIAFWILKVPAVVSSVCAGLIEHYHWDAASLTLGAIASFCIIIDGVRPRGMLRNVHLRAVYDIRDLVARMQGQLASTEGDRIQAIRKIIGASETERQRILSYIRDAETSVKPNHESGRPDQGSSS